MGHDKDYETLRLLEESLWIASTRFDLEYMDKILATDFFEFGRSGRIYKREDTLDVTPQEIIATLPLKNFAIHPIDENTVLITYVSEVHDTEIMIGNRSSIWSKADTGWRLRFHQGTPVLP